MRADKSASRAGSGYSWLLAERVRTGTHECENQLSLLVESRTEPHGATRNGDPTFNYGPNAVGSVESDYQLYRFFDAQDNLLYVGQSCRIGLRLKAHEKAGRWRAVRRIEMESADSADHLDTLEEFAIVSERPAWNRAMVPDPQLSPGDEHFLRCLEPGQTVYLNNGDAGAVMQEIPDDEDQLLLLVWWENEDGPRWTHPRAIQMTYEPRWGKPVAGPIW